MLPEIKVDDTGFVPMLYQTELPDMRGVLSGRDLNPRPLVPLK